jgi:hypothetical protein
MKLTDPKWPGLIGGYRVPYDPRPALLKLTMNVGDKGAWDELWNELHHQGDVGEASYATVTALVDIYSERRPDWNLFSLVATIEVERHRKTNPPLPEWLNVDYQVAWEKLGELALTTLRNGVDEETLQSSLAVLAIARGNLKLGAMIIHLDSDVLDEILEQYQSWTELYEETIHAPL